MDLIALPIKPDPPVTSIFIIVYIDVVLSLYILLYVFMIFALGQASNVAEDRSILLASVILIYMLLFGHGLPKSINRNIM